MSDDAIDAWLHDALGAQAPRLSPDFDARVLNRVRPRRLGRGGRLALAAYGVVSLGVSAWLLGDVEVSLVAVTLLSGGLITHAAGRYVRSLVARP